METYRLLVQRKVTVTSFVYIEGDSEDDARARFQHQLESEQCSGIEDGESWGESFYYQVIKGSPYAGEFEVLEAEIDDADDDAEAAATAGAEG